MSPISEKLPSTLSTPPETPVSTAHDGLAELRTKIEKYRATLAPEKRSGADTLLASLEKTTLDGVQVTKNGIETSIDAKNRFLGTLTVDQKNLMGTIERGAAGISEKTKASIGEVRDIVSAVAG